MTVVVGLCFQITPEIFSVCQKTQALAPMSLQRGRVCGTTPPPLCPHQRLRAAARRHMTSQLMHNAKTPPLPLSRQHRTFFSPVFSLWSAALRSDQTGTQAASAFSLPMKNTLSTQTAHSSLTATRPHRVIGKHWLRREGRYLGKDSDHSSEAFETSL